MDANNVIGKCFWLGNKWEYLIYITNEKNLLLWHKNKTADKERSLRLIDFFRGKEV